MRVVNEFYCNSVYVVVAWWNWSVDVNPIRRTLFLYTYIFIYHRTYNAKGEASSLKNQEFVFFQKSDPKARTHNSLLIWLSKNPATCFVTNEKNENSSHLVSLSSWGISKMIPPILFSLLREKQVKWPLCFAWNAACSTHTPPGPILWLDLLFFLFAVLTLNE